MMKRILFKILRIAVFGLAVLMTLAALFLSVGNYLGKREWEHYRKESEARGTKFSVGAFVPPPVPDEQNFAMTPLLKELFGSQGATSRVRQLRLASGTASGFSGRWKGQKVDLEKWKSALGVPDLLMAFQKFEPELAEISQASRLPYSRFPLRYEDGFATAIPHVSILMNLQRLYALRALAYLERGDADRAFADEETLIRLAESEKDEPLLISQLVRLTLHSVSGQILWESLADHRWSDVQLAAIQEQLSRVDLLQAASIALENERAGAVDYWPKVVRDPRLFGQIASMGSDRVARNAAPATPLAFKVYYWFLKARSYQTILVYSRFYDRFLLAIDPQAHRISVKTASEVEKSYSARFGSTPFLHLDDLLTKLAAQAITPSLLKFAQGQAMLDQALIACGLERYRLAHGEYPDTLNALAPQYLAKLPCDVITGEPLHYRRTPEGLFVLYSVGWNGTDDSGVPATKKDGKQDYTQGDWVWRYPAAR